MAGINFSEIKEDFYKSGKYNFKRISWLDSQGNVLKTQDIRLPLFSMESSEEYEEKDYSQEVLEILEPLSFIPGIEEKISELKSDKGKIIPVLISILKIIVFYILKPIWISRN